MLIAKILNTQASLNSFKEIHSLDFLVGEAIRLVFQLHDPQTELRFVAPSTAVVKVTFNKTDATTLEKTASFIDAGDRSLCVVTLTSDESEEIMGGNLTFTVDLLGDESDVKRGFMNGALRKVITD